VTAGGKGGGARLRALVVEDDPGIARSMARGLVGAGYEVQVVGTGAQALAAARADVVLLDLGLPDMDGVEVCRGLRQRGDAAIIVVTARGEEGDRVVALDEGADDYLVKPFGLAELLARMRAVLRRIRPSGPAVYVHGPMTVDPRTRRVTVGGAEIALTPKEFDILECLAADPGRVVTRQELLERVWDANWYGPTKVLDVHVAALRRKLGVAGLVETVYGRGFRLGAVESEAEPEAQTPAPSPAPAD
jgi:DNA-binding response OmpR family regulator